MRVVTFEGINAAGKSEITTRVRDALIASGWPCLSVDPAGFGRVGRIIRKHLVDPAFKSSPDYDSVLFAALRTEGAMAIQEVLREEPLTIVLLQRYSLALEAYGAADGASVSLVSELRKLLRNTLPVDMTVLLDIGGSVAFERIARGAGKNRFEARGPSYLESVARNYRHFAAADGDVVLIDASVDVVTVLERVWTALADRWNDLRGSVSCRRA